MAADDLADVSDIHAAIHRARVRECRPDGPDEVARFVRRAAAEGRKVALSGGRHAMGGQQFLDGHDLLDLRGLDQILEFDHERGLVRAGAGIQWPALIEGVLDAQRAIDPDSPPRWGIAQKQTGADSLTLGGALSANIHGRGLLMPPIVGDVERFTLVDAQGRPTTCSRDENADLFALAIGGYGLFGVITDVTLRLAPRRVLRRVVRVIDIEDAVPAAERRIGEGFLYGDFQFDVDPDSPDFLTKGVFCGYSPVDDDRQPPDDQRALSRDDWLDLLTLAHRKKREAFTRYAQHYLATDGQLYWSDTHQRAVYLEGYHAEIDRRLGAACAGSEMITELSVAPERLVAFLRAAARLLTEHEAQVIYGTIRLIQPDTETVMAWAPQRRACVIFNLHIDHDDAAIARAADTFRALIDLAAGMGGSYYLTYHRWATPEQLERCYPRVREFFDAKRRFDPQCVFDSDWHRHYAPHFTGQRT